MDETAYTGELSTHNIDSYNKAWWTIGYGGVSYDGKSISSSDSNAAIIDSGTSFLYLPQLDYNNFRREMEKIDGVNCRDSENCVTYDLTCAEIAPKLKNLTIFLDNMHYVIPPYGYLLDSYGTSETCIIPVSSYPES